MHVVFRESHGLEDSAVPKDLEQDPAEMIVLSFSDSDLGAFASAWHRGDGALPSLRLANLADLRHPLSVDTYLERTVSGAKAVLVRLIGGVPYWDYGLTQLHDLAKRQGIALAVLAADGRADPRLDRASTLPEDRLRRLARLCDAGGADAAYAALAELALAAGLRAAAGPATPALPAAAAWTPEHGVCDPEPASQAGPRILIVFYRSYVVAADLAPIAALFGAFRVEGCDVRALFLPSLKSPRHAEWLRQQIADYAPHAIVNATAFSGKGADGRSPLDAGDVPVFQVALATSDHAAWHKSERGLSPADLAMHVVLPEVDGRIFAGAISFKEPQQRDPDLQYARMAHRADPTQIAQATRRVMGWLHLAALPHDRRRVALILSTYPGKDWNLGHAVGLDAPASARAILQDLAAEGYGIDNAPDDLEQQLQTSRIRWPVSDYRAALTALPETLRDALSACWGTPEEDPAVRDDAFRFAAIPCGNAVVALQPERGDPARRSDEYHDLARTPRHAYVAFYLWLAQQSDAIVHIGAHGTLEWLPGKSVALSGACWPQVLTGDLPVLYPFIVNDPGEAAQAKRRIGAVTLGHVPPPLRQGAAPHRLAFLEALLDEFSNADGLDPRRRDRLQGDIRAEAQALGLEEDLGLHHATSTPEAITRIDRFVCDVKDSQFGEGLHIWGRQTGDQPDPAIRQAVAQERDALIRALDGRFVPGGPAGSPYRGRRDVLPTGRNLFCTDPRAVPSRAAYAQGVGLADELVRRHLQDHGDWPRNLIVDLWGSATMRTAGEEFAMALHLLGVRPIWDQGSERVSGFEILPIAELDRPRLDVTLRVSGLFRDVFPTLSTLFAKAVRALAARDEAPDWNPFVTQNALARVYGPAPGQFGLQMTDFLTRYDDQARQDAGQAWLAASGWALDGDHAIQDRAGIAGRVTAADAFVHLQDLPETDLLLASDYAAHEAGFAAANAVTGGHAALYHLDSTDPAHPRARDLREEIARVVQARAANPDWIAGMRAHGFRGAAEIAATLDHMATFAHLAGVVGPHLFDLYHDATLGDPDTLRFLQDANPGACAAMQDQFQALARAGLWQTRRNSIRASLAEGAA